MVAKLKISSTILIKTLKKIIKEEIGRNFHTLDDDPHTFEDFSDYEIEIDGSNMYGFYLAVFFKNNKIFPRTYFSNYDDAYHHSRMVIDDHRVKYMNNPE
jgi:hypothetical protein